MFKIVIAILIYHRQTRVDNKRNVTSAGKLSSVSTVY
jgi:hypothetical protein